MSEEEESVDAVGFAGYHDKRQICWTTLERCFAVLMKKGWGGRI